MISPDASLIQAADLKDWVTRVFVRASLPNDDAAVAADVLVTANLRGIDSHGVLQLPIKTRRVISGIVNTRPKLRVERDSPSAMLVDGDNGLGMVVGEWAMVWAIERALEGGAAVVGVRRSNHFGMSAYYAMMASAADLIGIAATNASATMAPWGSVTPYLGTNPLAFAVPGGIDGGIVLDMATSQVAWGKVELAARAGKKIPLNWATDSAGRPTDDPDEAMKGMMLPLGGYKGYGLAFIVETLCGVMTGAAFGLRVGDFYAHPDREENAGHSFIAIDPARFMPLEHFKMRMAQMVEEIHACRPAEGVDRIYLPGEIEMETAARRRREGIPLPPDVVSELRRLGEEVRVPFPDS
ncbi:MAG: Ldh family oxidoreductase [Chloroflexi bacterium]|nr:Ldh family oxidoreductase [Chloroflexota bacterium]